VRRAARRDAGEKQIVEALEAAGCLVDRLNDPGVPDLAVYHWASRRFLWLELKDGRKPPSRRKLKPKQVTFHQRWAFTGVVFVVNSAEEALAIL